MQSYWEMRNGNLFTLWNRITHKVYSGLCIKQLITNEIGFKIFPIWSSNKTQSGFVYILEAQDVFREKMALVDRHNHDNRLDDNNQIG